MQTGGLVVVGGAVTDITAAASQPVAQVLRTSSPGTLRTTAGGVGRNVAEAAWRLGAPSVLMVSAVGDDERAEVLRANVRGMGMKADGLVAVAGASTATYCAVLSSDGELVGAVADMAVLQQLTPSDVDRFSKDISQARCVVCDGNISGAALRAALRAAGPDTIRVFEPTSVVKSALPVTEDLLYSVDVITPNEDELMGMARAAGWRPPTGGGSGTEVLREAAGVLLSKGLLCAVVTRGPDGVSVFLSSEPADEARKRRWRTLRDAGAQESWPAVPCPNVISVTGAGDSFVGGFGAALCSGQHGADAVRQGLAAAQAALISIHSVNPEVRAVCDRTLRRSSKL
eukprot:Hpha_TRINITY_DN33679_c0_g1::TRINITY_DN33679_c0_g1_i1::g.43299::m.43299